MLKLILKTLADLKQPAILWRLFVPFAAAIVLVSLLGYSFFGLFLSSELVTGNAFVAEAEVWTQEAEQTIGAVPIVGGVLLWFIGLVVVVIAGVLGVLVSSYLILLFAMLITGFMTDSLVKAVHDLHYPQLEYQGHGSVSGMLWSMAGYGLAILFLFIITIPMLFIPLVNIVWFWLLGFMFFRYSIVLDVGQVILPKNIFDDVKAFSRWTPTLTLGSLFLVSALPFIGLFVPVLAVIALAHYYFETLSTYPAEVERLQPNH